MSASNDKRHASPSSREDALQDLPEVAAAFLIVFDLKIGYTIAWKRCLPGVQLDGVVEYKSLPSGLHNVKEDLVYFVHDRYAGISAFVNGPAAEAERNARLVAVGVLVPLSYGRLGRSWEYAEELKRLAAALIKDTAETQPLEDFWEEHKINDSEGREVAESPSNSTNIGQPEQERTAKGGERHKGRRAFSDAATSGHPDETLPLAHPALSMVELLDAFGPLIFPLYRAALLRKRILLIGSAPVQLACDFVYNLSILSNIPHSTTEILPLGSESLFGLRPLFSLGVHDISFLEKQAAPSQGSPAEEEEDVGWIACTTDEVLAMKRNLYDIIVKLPSITEHAPTERAWPRMVTGEQQDIKATQRDLRRYQTLRADLSRLHVDTLKSKPTRHHPSSSPAARYADNNDSDAENGTAVSDDQPTNEDHAPLVPRPRSSNNVTTSDPNDPSTLLPPSHLIEQSSWSALAYDSFMWWASAGERSLGLQEEQERDHNLFGDVHISSIASMTRPRSSSSAKSTSSVGKGREHGDKTRDKGGRTAVRETSIIAYFHRLTHCIFETVAEIVEAGVDDGDGSPAAASSPGSPPPPPAGQEAHTPRSRITTNASNRQSRGNTPTEQEVVLVTNEDMTRMGLDEWSEADRTFVKELVDIYWGMTVEVRTLPRVECCGVRIC